MNGSWRLLDGPAGVLRSYVTATATGALDGPALLICHEFPPFKGGSADVGRTYPTLADKLAEESGWRVVTATLRGSGGSEGDFSAAGWLEDLRFLLDETQVGLSTDAGATESGATEPGATDAAPTDAAPTGVAPTKAPAGPGEDPVHVVGFGFGGALALRLAAESPRVAGVACLGSPADLSGWAADPARAVARSRASGIIHRRGFPRDIDAWAAEISALEPLTAVAALRGRPLLLVHGADDIQVPAAAARQLADAATGPVDLRIVPGAGQWLRADPRAVATLIGWLERRR